MTATDPHRESREFAKLWHDVDVLDDDIYQSSLPSEAFDTVILREVGEHLEFERALPEIARLARRAVVLFQTNVSPLVRAMRSAVGHEEFSSRPVDHYVDLLERAGFSVDTIRYTDVLAFPLSGGFVIGALVPDRPALWPWIFRAERVAAAAARILRLERQLCWRVLIRGVRHDPRIAGPGA